MNVNDLKDKTVLLAASGGLDSCTVTRWLTEQQVKVVACTADLGQPDEKDVNDIAKRMRACGAIDHVLVDTKDALAEAGLKVIQAQAYYEGRYWNTTGIARYVTAQSMIAQMKKRGITILSHGATGRGNDQVRFQLATNMLAPDFSVYAPWRDDNFIKAFGGRAQMIDFCESRKLPITSSRESPYSTDANMLGLTHEAGKLESLETPSTFIKPGMGVHAKDAPNTAERVTLRFEKGRPVSINGKSGSLTQLFQIANETGGRNGVGIGVHLVENRFVGIKSRGIYEGPGIELLGTAYALLLELVIDRRARELFDSLSRVVSKQIYQGYWYDPCTQMALAALEIPTRLVTGTVTVDLLKGGIHLVSLADTPHSLYSEANASMESIGTYNHADSEGLLRVLGVSARVLAATGQIKQ